MKYISTYTFPIQWEFACISFSMSQFQLKQKKSMLLKPHNKIFWMIDLEWMHGTRNKITKVKLSKSENIVPFQLYMYANIPANKLNSYEIKRAGLINEALMNMWTANEENHSWIVNVLANGMVVQCVCVCVSVFMCVSGFPTWNSIL